jgi:hypothetical protein
MKTIWALVLAFLAGGLGGAVGATVLVGGHYNRIFEGWYLMGVVEQAQIARQIRGGEGGLLAERIEGSLPGYALAVSSQFGRSSQSLPALWSVRELYRATATPIPDELADLLASLPPKPPGCCVVERPEPR